MPETVQHNKMGLIVPPADSDALASAIGQFYEQGLAVPFATAVRSNKMSASWMPLVEMIEQLMTMGQQDPTQKQAKSPRVL
jgi:hypothetical protein